MLKKGVDLQFNSDISSIVRQADGSLLATLQDGRTIETDCVFYATGRRPMLDNLGLENVQVEYARMPPGFSMSAPMRIISF